MKERNQNSNEDDIEVSFLVPVYNGIEYTKEFLDSFNNTIKETNRTYEMLIGDNGSTDGSRDFLKTLVDGKTKVFLNEENLFYGGNMNNLARHARGKFLVLMNNDLILTPGWLEPMLKIFDQEKGIGIVGNIQMIPKAETMDHMGVAFIPTGLPFHVTASRFPKMEYTEWNAVTGACIVMLKDIFLKIGGYDEVFKNGYEDTDLCFRIKQAGMKIYTANRSIIYHYTLKSGVRTVHISDNAENLLKKWQEMGAHFYETERQMHQKLQAEEYLWRARRNPKWWRISIKKFFKAFRLIYLR